MDTDPTRPGSALDAHITFFDVDRDGRITPDEIRQALGELGFAPFTVGVLTPVLALLPSEVEALRGTRHDDTGAFDRDGDFDEAAFADWFARTDRDGSGDLTRWELLLGSLKLADDPVSAVASVAELQLVHGLLGEGGRLTRAALLEFLNGELFARLVAARAGTA